MNVEAAIFGGDDCVLKVGCDAVDRHIEIVPVVRALVNHRGDFALDLYRGRWRIYESKEEYQTFATEIEEDNYRENSGQDSFNPAQFSLWPAFQKL
jgi:hypothetical protein